METRSHQFESEPHPNLPSLSLQEKVLAAGMLDEERSNTINYYTDPDGSKRVNAIQEERLPQLVSKFRQDPKDTLAMGRLNLLAIGVDKGQSKI